MVKIYTKTGDRGQTGTMRGRMGKGEQLAVALGSVDELNSWIGVCRGESLKIKDQMSKIQSKNKKIDLDRELKRAQGNLLRIGAILAGAPDNFVGVETRRLERLIDKLTGDLPSLRNFIYPTGAGVASYLQVARTVARRTEREVVLFVNPKSEIQSSKSVRQTQDPEYVEGQDLIPKPKTEENLLTYLNRLSDALFVMARWVNLRMGGEEEVWC